MTVLGLPLLGETLLMTALLIAAVLLLRRPAAAWLGPRFAYALWLLPALRLVLPPLPGGERVVMLTTRSGAADQPLWIGAAEAPAAPPGLLDAMMPLVPLVWATGAAALLAMAVWRHIRWHRALLCQGTELDPVEGIDVVMSDAVDGPVAVGLLRRTIAVPADFFARYNRHERELAIAHEVAHHRAGDLWANAAALVVLAAQWFNPLAWAAHRAFRFDQEAACDARVLADLSADHRARSAHSYACAIAKSVAGPRLLLAAPMTSGTKVKERLHMLTQEPRLGRRPLTGRLLLAGAATAVLALTMSSLPARIVYAAEPAAAPPVSDAPKAPGTPTTEEKRVRQVIVVKDGSSQVIDLDSDDAAAAPDGKPPADGKKRVVHRIVVSDGDAAAAAPRVMVFESDGKREVGQAPSVATRFAFPFLGLNEDELRAAMAEQGIDGAKADAVIKSLDKKRADARQARLSMVPLIPSAQGFPMTEETYRKLRQMAVPSINEKELLERTLNAMTAARDSYARKVAEGQNHTPAVLESLDREIEHLKGKIKRM